MKNATTEVVVELGGSGLGEVCGKRCCRQEVYEVLLPLPARSFVSAFSELLQCLNQKAVQRKHCKTCEILFVNCLNGIKESGIQAVFHHTNCLSPISLCCEIE